jgi:serine/threonine-protein kinase
VNEGEIIAGKYRVLRALGEGGMGHVVLAEHVHLGERVAIKRLRPGTTGQGTASTRFLREARAAAKLRGEHIARATDFGVLEDGSAYLVLEYLEGEDLAKLLKRQGRVVTPEAVGYLLQACEGLAEAHAEGLVHRDIKPANLFLTHRPDGTPLVKVLDFGVAKRMEPDLGGETSGLTGTGAMMGSPVYMSPEQLSSSKDVGPTADVWGLSVVLYELLTGKQPFGGETFPAIAGAILYVPSPDPCAIRHAIPRALGDVVLKGLAKKPEDRFQSVGELARALAPFANDDASVHASRASRILRESSDGRVSYGSVPSAATAPISSSFGAPASASYMQPGASAPSPSGTLPSAYAPSPAPLAAASTTGGVSSARVAPSAAASPPAARESRTLPMVLGGLVVVLALGGLGLAASRLRAPTKPAETPATSLPSPPVPPIGGPTSEPTQAALPPAASEAASTTPSPSASSVPGKPSATAKGVPVVPVVPKPAATHAAGATPSATTSAPKVDPCAVPTITDPKTGEIRVKPGCR